MRNQLYRQALWMIIAAISFIIISCKDQEIAPSADLKPSEETLVINDFIWKSLNEIYLWKDQIPQNIDRNQEFESQEFFEKLLFKPTDRWSFITEDYEGLINSFKGIEESFGHNFKLYLLSGNSVIGVVKYVISGSPADNAGIKRGDIFL